MDLDRAVGFLRTYKEVSKFALDHETRSAASKKDGNAEIQELLGITRLDFLKHLYQNRPTNEELVTRKLLTTDFFCLVGPEGSGKTSLTHQVARDLEGIDPSVKVFVFDLTALSGFREYLKIKPKLAKNPDLFAEFLRERILELYKATFFRPDQTVDEVNAETAFYSYVLDLARLDEATSIFTRLVKIQHRAFHLFNRYKQKKGNGEADFVAWLTATRYDESTDTLIRDLEALLDLRHYVFAVQSLYGISRQIVWYENADALSREQQAEIFGYVARTHAHLGQFTSAVVSIRAENIRRFEIETGTPGRAEYIVIVKEDATPALDLRMMPEDQLAGLVRKRLVFTRDRVRDAVSRLSARHDRLEKRLSDAQEEMTKPRLGEKKQRQLLKRIRALEKEIALNQRRLALVCDVTDEEFDFILEVSDRVVVTMISEKALSLANGSLRELLGIHRDFLISIVRLYKSDAKKLLEEPDWYLSTLILRSLRRGGKSYQLGAHDLLETVREWNEYGGTILGCSLSHLISTVVWNLQALGTLGGRPTSSPMVSEVLQRLEVLGVPDSAAKQAMFKMFWQNGRGGSVLDFRPVSPETAEGITPNLEIFLTLRGRALVGRTVNSFGYMYESVDQITRAGTTIMERPGLKDTATAFDSMIPYLCHLAEMYLSGLEEIRQRLGNNHFWLTRYLDEFGVPCYSDDELTPSNIGFKVGGIYKALQMQLLLHSLSQYVRRDASSRQKIRSLENAFNARLVDLRDFKTDSETDFFKQAGAQRVFHRRNT